MVRTEEMGIVTIIILVLILAIILAVGIGGYIIYKRVTGTVKNYSSMIFGTPDPVEGLKRVELENAETPKSVSAATSLYLPQIMEDFPEFHYDEMKTRAENLLISYLRSIDASSASLLTEGMDELKTELEARIQMNRNRDVREHFERIQLHRMEIYQYRKANGRCSVVLQAAVEYIHYAVKEGKVVEGRKDLKTQSRYNVELVYIQDRDTIENIGESGLGLNCPNCGAPLDRLGAKVCRYCDTPVIAFNIKTWDFSSVKQV